MFQIVRVKYLLQCTHAHGDLDGMAEKTIANRTQSQDDDEMYKCVIMGAASTTQQQPSQKLTGVFSKV